MSIFNGPDVITLDTPQGAAIAERDPQNIMRWSVAYPTGDAVLTGTRDQVEAEMRSRLARDCPEAGRPKRRIVEGDTFVDDVAALVAAMTEAGVVTDGAWFEQEFRAVKRALVERGLLAEG